MDGLFLGILNLSLYGSFAIVAVLILRFLLKKSPKSISYGLWLVVFLALIPVSYTHLSQLRRFSLEYGGMF